MKISIIEPKGIIWQGAAREALLPAAEGQVCILDFHQSFLMRLKNGVVRVPGSRTVIKGGLAYMRNNALTVFVEA